MNRNAVLLFFLIFAWPSQALPDAAGQMPVVAAAGEELTGRWVQQKNQIAEFRGIPFAAPPVGPLRWRAPQPHAPRAGPQTATQFASACMQGTGNIDWYMGVAESFGHAPEVVARPVDVSEDCLYLNVWTPETGENAGLPVMVFVHGGSNTGGWSYEPNYIGARLAARGVVVVTITYRLGPFGFFAHPALEESSDGAAANFALLDIRAAFQWVHRNISAFGGDPGVITAFGESSGAFNLVDLLVADLAQGRGRESLFSRLISQSIGGPPVTRRTLQEEQATGVSLAEQLGLGLPVTAERLRQVPAADLLAAARQLPQDHYFSAAVDGESLPEPPLEVLRSADAAGIQVMAGTNADEWYMYIDEKASRRDLEAWLEEFDPEQRESLLAQVAEESDSRRAIDRLRTARNMLCPSRYLAMQLNENGGRSWVYYFNRQRTGPGGQKLGVYHGAELPYVFNSHDSWLPVEEADLALTETILDFWVQFAKTGDPNLPGKPDWPAHSRENPAVMELGDRIGEMDSFATDLCRLLAPDSAQTTQEN